MAASAASTIPTGTRPGILRRAMGSLYLQVVIAIVVGVAVGAIWPATGEALQPIGEGFIKLVKMIIAPVIFLTVVTGIGNARGAGTLGRVVGKTFAYFLTFSTLALIIGLIVANVVQPGAGMHIDPATLDSGAIAEYHTKAEEASVTKFLLDIIPTTAVSALTEGSILQALFVAVLFGIALMGAGEAGARITGALESLAEVVFRLVGILMRAAPIGAFGAMAFTIGKYGLSALADLAALIATFYITSLLFVVFVLGLVARYNGFSVFRLIAYLKEELLLVLGTSSSEAALPRLLQKMEAAGCPKAIVGLVVPTGYSFNLDGTNIYMTLAALFIAQATGVELSIGQQIALLLVAMISSKGAAGVTGAGFITLAATLSIVPSIPLAGMALILGIDRFMSECRALTNFTGNAVATIVISRWEGQLDRGALDAALHGAPRPLAGTPAFAVTPPAGVQLGEADED
ncbi:C4-dicarboxylate transporter DctA [Tsuneonella rigui]|uniref:C4-dicarboxylate transporter DctA n=1 Tax=Tsuneonella rigui TaxID=1708790 RepID=UPI000F7FABDC